MVCSSFLKWDEVFRERTDEIAGDTAVALLKAGAEADKKDVDGKLPLELAPDSAVRKFILQSAEREGIDL
jgi:hypothetical protein